MNLSIRKVRTVFPNFNKIELNENDFWRACKRFKITVKQMPLLIDGYYQKRRGRHFIVINSSLTGSRWLHTALHEFFHFLLDAPMATEESTLYRKRGQINKREKVADALALIGMIPFCELEKMAKEDVAIYGPETMKLIKDRIAVLAYFGK
jgi:Zn-dependent peptidase ImmA (M78 family)